MTLAQGPEDPQFAAAWKRSFTYGIDRHVVPAGRPIPEQQLNERIFASRLMLESAMPYVDHLYQTVQSECIVAICDADGILLATRGERLPDELLQQHTTPGICWSEQVFGCNAIGTAMTEMRPVHIVGADHFIYGLQGMSCAATPLCNEEGELVGCLAIAAHKKEHSPYMLGTVLSIGHAIEKAMILKSEHYRTLLLQETLIETSNNLILVTDDDGWILHINEAAKQTFGIESMSRLHDVFGEMSAALLSLNTRRELTDFRETMNNPNTGEEHYIIWDTHWVNDPMLDQSTLLLVGRDMTKYMRLERANKQAERLSTMGKFSAQIAHEIRNPVAVIKLAMQLMLAQEEFSEKSAKKGQMVLNELRRIEDLVNHFLDISKPQMPQICDCNITQLLRDTCNLMQSVFVQNDLRLVEHLQDVGMIRADCDQLHQVFLNLLRNAIDATPSGGTVEVTLKRDDEEPYFIVIKVSDNGQGIPQDRLQDVFEPFYTTKSRGTGLGLSNAKSIIEAHGGDMLIESAVNHGTHISIWLPFEQEPA